MAKNLFDNFFDKAKAAAEKRKDLRDKLNADYAKAVDRYVSGLSQTAQSRYPGLQYKASYDPTAVSNYLSSNAMYRPSDNGDVFALNDKQMRQGMIDNRQLTSALSAKGNFDSVDYLTKSGIHLTTPAYRNKVLETIAKQLEASKDADAAYDAKLAAWQNGGQKDYLTYKANENSVKNWLAAGEMAGKKYTDDSYDPTDEDMLYWYNKVNGTDYKTTLDMQQRMGLDADGYSDEWDRMVDLWYEGVNSGFTLPEYTGMTDPRSAYKSQTSELQNLYDIVSGENNRVAAKEAIENELASTADFDTKKLYKEPEFADGFQFYFDAMFDEETKEKLLYNYINGKWLTLDGGESFGDDSNATSGAMQDWQMKGYNLLTPEQLEKANVAYDEGRLQEYLDIIQPDLYAAANDVAMARVETASENPVVGTLLDVAAPYLNLAGSLTSFAATALGVDDPNDPAHRISNAVSTHRTTRANEAESLVPGIGAAAYNIAASAEDFATMALLGNALSSVSGGAITPSLVTQTGMAVNAAGGGALEGINEGFDPATATGYGAAVAALEFISEKLPIDKLFNNDGTLAVSLSEALEEMFSGVVEPGVQAAFAAMDGQPAQVQQIYKYYEQNTPKGSSPAKATMLYYLDNALQQGVGGAFIGGGANIAYKTAVGMNNRQIGKDISTNNGFEQVLEIAGSMDKNTASYAEAEKIKEAQSAGKKISLGKMGRLATTLQKELGEEYGKIIGRVANDTIVDRMVELGDSKEVAQKNVEAVKKVAYGGNLTEQERADLTESNTAVQVVEELAGDADTAGEMSSAMQMRTMEAASDLRGKQKRLQDAVYGKQIDQSVFAEESENAPTTVKAKPGTGTVTFLGEASSNQDVTGVGTEAALTSRMRNMTASQRNTVNGIKAIAKATGVNMVLFESTAEGRAAAIQNGSFVRGTNTIYLDINAGISTEAGMKGAKESGVLGYAMIRTLSHELTHFIEANGKEGYNALMAQAKREFAAKGKDWDRLVEAKAKASAAQGEKLTRTGAEAEVLADACEMMLQDTAAIERLAKQNPSLKDKIAGFIKSFVQKIQNALRTIGAGSKEAKALMEMRDGLMQYTEELTRLWGVALEEAVENTQSGAETTEVTGKQYAMRDASGNEFSITQREIEENKHLVANAKPVVTLNGNPFAKNPNKNFKEMAYDYLGDNGIDAYNPVLGTINIGMDGIEHLIAFITSRRSALLPAVKPVIEQGHIINIDKDHKAYGFDTAVIASVVSLNGRDYYMGVAVKENNDGTNGYYVHDAVLVEKKSLLPNKSGLDTAGEKAPTLAIILSDLANYNREFVGNTQKSIRSPEFQRWFGDSAVVNEDGSPKVMYHGTPYGDFTVFKGWQYFTDDKSYADRYHNPGASSIRGRYPEATNKKTYAVYLSVKKPFDTRLPEVREIWENEFFGNYSRTPLSEKGLPDWTDGIDLVDFIEENEYDFDGIILDEGATGGYGDEVQSRGVSIVVRKPSQIKSATDNVGTYDSNNPDIRYSQRSSASDIYEQYREVYTRLSDARKKDAEAQKAMKASGELDAMYDLMKNDLEAGIKAYQELLDKYGVTGLNINELQEEADNLYRQWDEARTAELEEEERKQLEKSGKSIEDYHRDKAVKEFGYTPYFYDGGYIVPNGKMLNFSGEKGRHYGSRGQDHRAIGTIYVNKEGSEAMVAFMHEGNIRLMPESPGLDIATSTEPTTQQYATIRRFVREYMDQEFLSVDFTDENGSVVGNLEYEGKIYADRVVNDIKYYYATGKIRDQGVSRYQHSQRKADDATVRDFLRDMKPTTTMNETERILLKRYQSALEEVAQKEIAIAEQENIIASGAEGDELIKAKNRLGILRKQAERANKNLLAAEQHDGFARIMATSQETISKYLGTTDNVADATDRLEAEIKVLEDSLGRIRGALTKAAEGQKAAFARGLFDRKQLKSAAERLKANYGSKMSVENIADRLALVYSELYAGGDDKAARFGKAARSLAIDLVRKNKFGYKSDVLPMLRDNMGTISLGETDLAEIKNAGLTLAEYKRTLAPYVRISSTGDDLSSHVSNAAYYGDGYLASILGDGYEGDFAMRLYEVVKSEKAKEASAGYDGKTEDEIVFEALVDIAGAALPIESGTATTKKLRNELLKFAGDTEAAAAKVDTAIKKAKAASDSASSVWREAVKNETLTNKVVDYYRALEEQRRLLEMKEQKQMLTEQLNSDAAKKLLETRKHYQEMFQRDRVSREINAEAAKKSNHIKAVVKRLDDRIRHETDYHNVKESMKPAVHRLVQTFIDGFGSLVFDRTKADRLKMVYDALADAETDASAFYSDDVAAMIQELALLAEEDEARRKAPSGSLMDNAQHKLAIYSRVADIADNIWHMVQMADEVFVNGKKTRFAVLGDNTGNAMLERADYKQLYGWKGKVQKALDDTIRRGNMIPTYFFESLNNNGMKSLFDSVMAGQTKYAKTVLDGRKKMQETKRKYNYASWAEGKPVTYKSKQGHELSLTTEQMLWVYATAKRERSNELAATDHLGKGGFRYEGEIKGKKGLALADKPHILSEADVQAITGMLTAEQKAYADEMVEYLSTDMAEVGNAASMEMFGIRKYQEGYYFPFKTASEQRYQRSDAGSTSTTNDSRVKHASFTHRLTRHANSTLVMGDFSSIIADHINQMATYASFMNPIESMNRVLNYKVQEKDGTLTTIRALLGRKYGEAALNYVQDFMKDINGGAVSDNRGMGMINAMVSAFKRGAVAASMSVAVQQPTAYVRAFAYMDPKYFAHLTGERTKAVWDEVMKYSGTAVIKDMGKFDVGLGQTANEWITQPDKGEFSAWERTKKYWPWGEGHSWTKAKESWDNLTTALPGYLDQWAWTHIWKAVKAEQHDLNPNMDTQSETFLKMCGDRFDFIINHTQVYDSVLSRSSLMRSKNAFHRMATSFMSEPTLTANVMYSALAGQHTKAQRGKMVASTILSNILAAAAAAAISAWNDDEDERTAIEKYTGKFTSLVVDNVLPHNWLPYVSDVFSLLEGYDVERADMSVVKDIIDYTEDFWSSVAEGQVPSWKQWENFVGTLLNLAGVSAKNISRDLRRLLNLAFKTEFSAPEISAVGYTALENLPFGIYKDSNKAYYERYATALASGDKQKAYNLKDFLVSSKKVKEDTFKNGAKDAMKKLVLSGDLSDADAKRILLDNKLVADQKTAFQTVDRWHEGSENYSAYNTVREAFMANNEKEIQTAINELKANGYTPDEISDYIKNQKVIREAVEQGKITPEKATYYLRKYAPYKNDKDNVNKPREWADNQ